MKRICYFVTFVIWLSVSFFAQDLQKKAEENPLDFAFFMIKSHNSPEDYSDELREIATGYFNANRKVDALTVIELMESKDEKTDTLKIITHWLIRDKKFKEAGFYLSKASEANRKNVYGINIDDSREIAAYWINLNNENKAFEEVEFFESEGKQASVLAAIANAFIKNRNFEKASNFLSQAKKLIEPSENTEFNVLTKAQIAKSFSEIKNQKDSLKLISEVEKDYESVEYSRTYPKENEIYNLIAETYLNLGHLEKAFELIEAKVDRQTAEGLIRLAEMKIKIGLKEDAKELLQKVSVFENESSSQFQAVKLYQQIDEDAFALELAKSIPSDSVKFDALMGIADKFFENGRTTNAIFILNYTLDQILWNDESNFTYDDFFSKEEKLGYIFDGFNKLKRPDLALKVINLSYKTDVRAAALATFTYLYKDKISRKTALEYLAQSLKILQNNKRDITEKHILDIWMKTAVQFADYGEKEKSLQIFPGLLKKISKDGYLSDSKLTTNLVQIGLYFEQTKLLPDKKMKIALKKVRDKWLEDNF